MGGCISKNPKIISMKALQLKKIVKIKHWKLNVEYLDPAIRAKINEMKNSKVPTLDLKSNVLYTSRMKSNCIA